MAPARTRLLLLTIICMGGSSYPPQTLKIPSACLWAYFTGIFGFVFQQTVDGNNPKIKASAMPTPIIDFFGTQLTSTAFSRENDAKTKKNIKSTQNKHRQKCNSNRASVGYL